ncbi:MAG TPA: CocE/NonD family hydrolase [Candidatus Thermoplasmatota archaeon]|jgi:hypothetical protein|nr:CocE/NonD family hydrolase [Candidatus Thermoplasmatota archaeon]
MAKRALPLALALMLAGCLAPAAPPAPLPEDPESMAPAALPEAPRYDAPPPAPETMAPAAPLYPACVHPYPCGDGSEWPAGLRGPFEVASVETVRVASFDGTELEGWIVLPALPEGVKAPAVLWTHPYFGQNYEWGDEPSLWDNSAAYKATPVALLVEQGYAVAMFSVRGSGHSGGCFGMFGPDEQHDQAFLVEWVAAQAWSNGRVGFMGLSYHGTTPIEAAINDPPHLKTIVVSGIVSDLYTFYHTPQGAVFTVGAAFQDEFDVLVSLLPPASGSGLLSSAQTPARWTTDWAPVAPDRICPEVLHEMSQLWLGTATDVRDADYWAARRLIERAPDITAAVLLAHGFQDQWGSGHAFQESLMWGALTHAPKRQLEGQWAHEFPNFNSVTPSWAMEDWNDRLLGWLDFWLKGLGPAPPGEGRMDYQDSSGLWHSSSAWPPAEAHDEVLYLTDAALAPQPGAGSATFRDAPRVDAGSFDLLCDDLGDLAPLPTHAVFATEPAASDVLLAGNPFAVVQLTSDLPGGVVGAYLYDLAPDFRCDGGAPQGARRLAAGAADLRFHAGNLQGEDFPTGAATDVRIDLTDFAELLPAGHRIALALGWPNLDDRAGQPFFPSLEVVAEGGGSVLVLPVVQGTLGGAAPAQAYPPRPFASP